MAGTPPGLRLSATRRCGAWLIELAGVVDDQFDPTVLWTFGGQLVLDMAGVESLNSIGIRRWVAALERLEPYYAFVRCPPSFVWCMNMITGFAGKGEVVSFVAPYRCAGCDHAFDVPVDLRTPPPRLAERQLPDAVCPACGGPGELDEPPTYLAKVATLPRPAPPPAVRALLAGADCPVDVQVDVRDGLTAVWLAGAVERGLPRRLGTSLGGTVVGVLESVTTSGPAAVAALGLLAAPGVELHLARVPAALAAELGGARIVSVLLPHRCPACGCTLEIDLPAASLAVDLRSPRRCPVCGDRLAPAPPPPLASPAGEVPPAVADYLVTHPTGPGPSRGPSIAPELRFGKYQLVSSLGVGGMGRVFLAHHVGPGGFKKSVALKRVLLRDPDLERMFLREARLAASLSHPNVVQVFELGRERGEYYLAMEYVEGWSLREVLRGAARAGRSIPAAIACRIVGDVCTGLRAAHAHVDEQGQPAPIVHRDVSPHNILLSVDGWVKITDFGVATLANSESSGAGLVGKVAYLAPEYVAGEVRDATLVDVYAAGAVLYECLVGAPPYRRDSEAATLRAILEAPPVPAALRRADLPAGLDAVVSRALARDPSERHRSAHELAGELEAQIAHLGPVTTVEVAAFLRELGLALPHEDRTPLMRVQG